MRCADRRQGLLAAALCVVTALGGCAGDDTSLNRGDVAPSFVLVATTGQRVAFPRPQEHAPGVVRFWADWCPYCYQEMKDIEPIAARLQAERLVVLAVNVGQRPATVRAFADRLALTYPVLVDEGAATARAYGVKALPTTFFVAGDGRIHNKLVGEADAATFERLARELLAAERAAARP